MVTSSHIAQVFVISNNQIRILIKWPWLFSACNISLHICVCKCIHLMYIYTELIKELSTFAFLLSLLFKKLLRVLRKTYCSMNSYLQSLHKGVNKSN